MQIRRKGVDLLIFSSDTSLGDSICMAIVPGLATIEA